MYLLHPQRHAKISAVKKKAHPGTLHVAEPKAKPCALLWKSLKHVTIMVVATGAASPVLRKVPTKANKSRMQKEGSPWSIACSGTLGETMCNAVEKFV